MLGMVVLAIGAILQFMSYGLPQVRVAASTLRAYAALTATTRR